MPTSSRLAPLLAAAALSGCAPGIHRIDLGSAPVFAPPAGDVSCRVRGLAQNVASPGPFEPDRIRGHVESVGRSLRVPAFESFVEWNACAPQAPAPVLNLVLFERRPEPGEDDRGFQRPYTLVPLDTARLPLEPAWLPRLCNRGPCSATRLEVLALGRTRTGPGAPALSDGIPTRPTDRQDWIRLLDHAWGREPTRRATLEVSSAWRPETLVVDLDQGRFLPKDPRP